MLRLAHLASIALVWTACAEPADDPPSLDPSNTPQVEVVDAIASDISPPLRDLTPTAPISASLAPPIGANFLGLGNGLVGPGGTFIVQSVPPSPRGDVGLNHYVQVVNQSFAVFDKTGKVLLGPASTNTLWAGFGGGCQTNNDGDAAVRYDRIANRWVITQFSVSTTPYLECVAVSTTPDPTGTYYRYAFSYGPTDYPSYPQFALWPDAYYVTYNIFQGGVTFAGARVCALNRASLLTGVAASQLCYNTTSSYGSVLVGDLDGATPPPANSPAFVLGLGTDVSHLAFWKFHPDFATPANSSFVGPVDIGVPAFSYLCLAGPCVPQPGTAATLEGQGDLLMNRLVYRNFGDHEALFATHAVQAGSSSGMRWYELRNPTSTLTVFQSGTYAPDSNWRWMGSIAADRHGDIALGYSTSSSTVKPSIRYTARRVYDASGTMTLGEGTIMNGPGIQTNVRSFGRWGDSTSLNVDPADDCTFWYTNQYEPTDGEFNWSTRIASFQISNCTDITVPVVSLTSPAANTTVSGSPTLAATASDDRGVTKVEFYVDNTLVASDASAPYSTVWSSASVPDGWHTLMAKAYDLAGNVGTGSITVFVKNHATVELVVNGGFETGTISGWSVLGLVSPSNMSHTGSWAAQIGSTSSTPVMSTLTQSITLPGSGTSKLSLAYKAQCFGSGRLRAYVTRQGLVVATLFDGCPLSSWSVASVDLTAYAGSQLSIVFSSQANGSTAWMYVDDVSVTNQ